MKWCLRDCVWANKLNWTKIQATTLKEGQCSDTYNGNAFMICTKCEFEWFLFQILHHTITKCLEWPSCGDICTYMYAHTYGKIYCIYSKKHKSTSGSELSGCDVQTVLIIHTHVQDILWHRHIHTFTPHLPLSHSLWLQQDTHADTHNP